MKKSSLILVIIFLFAIISSFQNLNAQETTKKEIDKELKMQEAINKQKKEMADQMKIADDQRQAAEDSVQNAIEAIKSEAIKNINSQKSNRMPDRFNRGPINNIDSFIGRRGEFPYHFGREGDAEKTSWDIFRQVNKSTFNRGYNIDVEPTAKSVVISVVGDCRTGEIKVSIMMPRGKTYSEVVIDESGSMNLRKSFAISGNENKDKIGEWVFSVKAKEASGFFKISVQTY